jgi:integrase/recombinase XerD
VSGSHRVEFTFVGDLAELLVDFVLYKRSLGFQYCTEARLLSVLSRQSARYDLSECKLPKQLVADWSKKRPYETTKTQRNRIDLLRQLAIYLQQQGHQVNMPIPPGRMVRSSFTPYIFNRHELSAIFAVSDQLNLRNHPVSNMQQTFPVLIRMLYGCGLRISEAIKLRVNDVDLNQGILTISDSKNKENRLVPMSDSLTAICRAYYSRNCLYSEIQGIFFSQKDGTAMCQDTVYKRFRRVLWDSGVSHGGRGRGPRLHDLRHSFAVHALKNLADKGVDLYCSLPILSTYLGHRSVDATNDYVRLTQEMYPELVSKASAMCAYVIPEVKQQS